MTPEEELVSYGTRVLRWDIGLDDYIMQHIPLKKIFRASDGRHLSREQYLKIRRRLRKYEFYATRVIGPHVIKKKCTNTEVSERHGYICSPDDWGERIGRTMLLVKDDDPCSTEALANHLKDAARVVGWQKDLDGIMKPVYRGTQGTPQPECQLPPAIFQGSHTTMYYDGNVDPRIFEE